MTWKHNNTAISWHPGEFKSVVNLPGDFHFHLQVTSAVIQLLGPIGLQRVASELGRTGISPLVKIFHNCYQLVIDVHDALFMVMFRQYLQAVQIESCNKSAEDSIKHFHKWLHSWRQAASAAGDVVFFLFFFFLLSFNAAKQAVGA